MNIIKGLKSGAVLQRNDRDVCEITFSGEFAGDPVASPGKIVKVSDSTWKLTDIFVGGPYELTIRDERDTVTFTDIYVGDLWLLAGQSNMEGAGHVTAEDRALASTPCAWIRAYYMNDEWAPAKPILHHLHLSKDVAHKNAWSGYIESIKEHKITVNDLPPSEPKRAVGPGLYFAKKMFALTGVPQGVIPAAVGGAPIGMWLPSGEENYYSAACRRIEETGNNIKGVFWAQGEGNPNADVYPDQIESIRSDLCKRLGVRVIPWVQLQSFKCTLNINDENAAQVWSRFREMQRTMPYHTEMLSTVATNDLELDDCIHLSSDSQKTAGCRGAMAMQYLLTGKGHAQPNVGNIYLKRFSILPEKVTEVHIGYENVVGNLRANGVPCGFSYRRCGDDSRPSAHNLCRIRTEQNEIVLRIEIPLEELMDYEIWYGYGNDFYCNITDEANRAIPSMGPILIREWEKNDE